MAKLLHVDGDVDGNVSLPKNIFSCEPNIELLAQAVRVYRENQRQNNAHTKTRSAVSGGGRKPYRQKGTGRARQGTTRAGQWAGGGVIFGPLSSNPRLKRLTKKMRALAISSALSQKNSTHHVFVLESSEMDTPKTKFVRDGVVKTVDSSKQLYILKDNSSNFTRSLSNIPDTRWVHVDAVGTYDVLNSNVVVIEKSALDVLKKRYASKKGAK